MTENNAIKLDKVMLVIVQFPLDDFEYTVNELTELVRTANGKVVNVVTQNRNDIDRATMVGSGKLIEINEIAKLNDVDVIVFNKELNSIQRRNIGQVVDCAIIDKTDLILDIFALHAVSAEGKKQVELAQLAYSLSSKNERNFSRQGGGIGTRGPGETQLETDKRRIREKIHRLRQELKEIEKQRDLTRKQRTENQIFTVALVGYTNAGKSTLFNRLASEKVFEADQLFATLDTTTRGVTLENGIQILISDTVGFIKDLPHHLVEAFKSTLSELLNANLILNVCDISDVNVASQLDVTQNTLRGLGVSANQLIVYNKIDKQAFGNVDAENGNNTVFVSAKTGQNIDLLVSLINDAVMENYSDCCLKTDMSNYGKLLNLLNKYSVNFSTSYEENTAVVSALLPRKYVHLFIEYMIV